ncbi:hypothetical protein TWF481_006917 [Arthrobotrys musiformis]|uniref:Clr5 domain-containing protein n=1 Tax=Arthrobotrys musiformis TaxID=47236 RepID=A0AAV9WAS8_9PEZI
MPPKTSNSASRRGSRRRDLQLQLSEIDQHKEEIKFLYCVKGIPLDKLVDDINRAHGLTGTRCQYRDRLAAWGFRKRLKKAEWEGVQRALIERERLGKPSDVYLNDITIIPWKKVKRGISRNVTATDAALMKASFSNASGHQGIGTPLAINHKIDVRSPPCWNDVVFPPVPRNITILMLENLPIKITDKLLLQILLPMVSQYPEGSLQVSTLDANTYFVFLRTVVYSISNGLTSLSDIQHKLNIIDERGYRRPFKALLSENHISITIACEKLIPVFYYRGDEKFIRHIAESCHSSISYFAIISGLLELAGHRLHGDTSAWSQFKMLHDNFDIKSIRDQLQYKVCLRQIRDKLIRSCIRPKSFLEAKLLFFLCHDLGDFGYFLKVTPQNLVSALAEQHSEQQANYLLYTQNISDIQSLLGAGFKFDYGLEERVLGALVLSLEPDGPKRDFWWELWEHRHSRLSDRDAACGHNDEKVKEEDLYRIFDAATHYIYDPERNDHVCNQIWFYDYHYDEYGDIVDGLQKNDLPGIAFWEILLIAHLVGLRPMAVDLFLRYLRIKYPSVDRIGTYLFHVILRMSYRPKHYLVVHYGSASNWTGALRALLEGGLDINLELDSLVSPVSYVVQMCSPLPDSQRLPDSPRKLEHELELLDLLIKAGVDINVPLPAREIDGLGSLHDDERVRAIDIAYWGEVKELFCYLLSQGVHLGLGKFPMRPMELDVVYTPCPVFIQAVYRLDFKYISEHWDTRKTRNCSNISPPYEIELGVETMGDSDYYIPEEQISCTKTILSLEGYIPSCLEFRYLVEVLAVYKGLRSDPKAEDLPKRTQNLLKLAKNLILGELEIQRGFMVIEKYLTDTGAGANIHFMIPPHRNSEARLALHFSIFYDNVKLMEHLLNLGVDPLTYSSFGMIMVQPGLAVAQPALSAVQLAAGSGSLHCLKALVARGCDIEYPPDPFNGSTALQEAIRNGKLPCLFFLLSKGADIYTVAAPHERILGMVELPTRKPPALEYAILEGNIDAVSLILQAEHDCQSIALGFAQKHQKSAIATYIEAWKPGSHKNTTGADIELGTFYRPEI